MAAGSTYAVWGWGQLPTDEPSASDLAALAPLAETVLGETVSSPLTAAPLPELPTDRVTPRLPAELRAVSAADPLDRARHSIGRSYRDVVRAVAGRFDHVTDAVLRPKSESQVAAVLEWCADNNVAVVPFGGGTSVVGGVEPDV